MSEQLTSLDADFKTHHFAVVDALDEKDETGAATEQDVLDQHDDEVASLASRIDQLIELCSSVADSGARSVATRCLTQFQTRLSAVKTAITALTGDAKEVHLVYLYQEQLADYKKELGDIRYDITSQCTPKESDALNTTVTTLDKEIFDLSLIVKRLLYNPVGPSSAPPTHDRGVRLPKLDVPTFNGELLHWQTFWEQFCVAIQVRSDISDTEKLVYLQHAVKDGAAKNTIEGLSRSGAQYNEAVECLKSRYNRPRLIHQAHVRKISEIPYMKDGTGREVRRLHDTVLQHVRALKTMGHEPSGSFITSLLELKLYPTTMFEWQKHSDDCTDVPHYSNLLDFLNLRAQASETCSAETKRVPRGETNPTRRSAFNRSVASFAANTSEPTFSCVNCPSKKHPLYACPRFKALPHDKMVSTVRTNEMCMNCLKVGHFARQCNSLNRCRKCQKSHHTLLHEEARKPEQPSVTPVAEPVVTSHTAAGFASNALLMTCQLLVTGPDGTTMKVRGLLDSASSSSFVSERVAQGLRLPRSSQSVSISGIAGLSHRSPLHSIATFDITPVHTPEERFSVSALVVPRVTCDLPLMPIQLNSKWTHLSNLHLADPDFGRPGAIDILLGVDLYVDLLLQGWRNGPLGSPVALETKLGWVLAGRTDTQSSSHVGVASHHVAVATGDELLRKFWEVEENPKDASNLSPGERAVVQGWRNGPLGSPVALETKLGWVLAGRTDTQSPSHVGVASHHVAVATGDELLRKFWEVEENPKDASNLSPGERAVVQHFHKHHTRADSGRFIVPLPKDPQAKPLGESRSQAVRRFLSLERSLHSKNQFQEFSAVMEEYFEMDHAEPVPAADLKKPPEKVFYLPMHAVRKEHSTTTKIQVVFDASAKSSTGVSLNDTLLVGPTVHAPLIDVLLRFRRYRIALTTDVSKMYRAIELVPADRDLHRFVWRKSPGHIWCVCLILCCQHGSKTKRSRLLHGIPSCLSDRRKVILHRRWAYWSQLCQGGNRIASTVTKPFLTRGIPLTEVELQ